MAGLMILLCYDGSEDARAAIDHAGQLLSGQEATVLTAWEPFIEMLSRTSYGFGMSGSMVNLDEIDAANRAGAQTLAEEGAARARRVGLDAQPRASARLTTVPAAILETARELDADAIVVGSRGLTGIRSLLLGSVSHGVLQNADRPVIVVPSAAVASARGTRHL